MRQTLDPDASTRTWAFWLAATVTTIGCVPVR
jgi:hypothetical protein